MTLSGQLSDYSLPELLQVIEQGKKSGTLTFRTFNSAENSFKKKYISFDQGQVVAVSEDLSGQDLLSLLKAENLIDQKVFLSIMKLIYSLELKVPLGHYLRDESILNYEQLKSIFDVQVVQRICSLFELDNAWFTLNETMKPSLGELTGLSAGPIEVSLMGLRQVKRWANFTEKFPDLTSGLVRKNNRQPLTKLTGIEEKVFSFSTRMMSLKQIALELELEVAEVQKVAFCLISTGIVEELPILDTTPVPQINEFPINRMKNSSGKSSGVNQDFLMNLSSFLKTKTASTTATASNASKVTVNS